MENLKAMRQMFKSTDPTAL